MFQQLSPHGYNLSDRDRPQQDPIKLGEGYTGITRYSAASDTELPDAEASLRSSSIYYRVADFLKGFPPFSFVGDEDLLQLTGTGRVKFHEADEYVYWQGRKPGRFIFVIQQGTVELVDERDQAEALRDVLGEGDIIGAEALAGKSEYQYSAKTTSDVIIYALLAGELEGLAEQHAQFARYVESNFSVTPIAGTPNAADSIAGVSEVARLPVGFLARRLLTCADDTTLQAAFERMSKHGRDTLVVTNNGVPTGYLTDTSFRRPANGDTGGAARVTDLMHKPLPVLSEALAPHSYAVEMLHSRCSAVGITDSRGALKAVVTESDLTLLGVPNLSRLGHEIRQAQTTAELAELRRLALRFSAQSLTDPSAVVWVAEAGCELNRLIVSRAIELTEVAAGQDVRGSWVFFGAAARGELLTGAMPDVGLIYEDGDDEVAHKFGPRVSEVLRECGYHSSDDAITPANDGACRSLAEWKDSYSRWISDPVLSGLYAGLRFFEVAPVRGDAAPVEALRQRIREAAKEDESFIPILANDSMANLPPLTFFRGLVVEDDGERTDRFDLRRGTLQPLADVGRVFALERGDASPTRTDLRLAAAGEEVEEQRNLFVDAAGTFRVALYHQARIGLRDGTGGWEIEPRVLSKLEQQVLKNGFRTIMKLLEFTANRNGITPR